MGERTLRCNDGPLPVLRCALKCRMTILVYLWLSVFCPPTEAQVEHLRSLFPAYLSAQGASENLLVAEATGLVFRQDPSVLLSIAFHESNFKPTTVTPEPGRRVSCGVMTPVPKSGCSRWELTLLGGYESGAQHLALWQRYYKGRSALLAYAGGGVLARSCALQDSARCRVADVFTARARLIAQQR